MKRSDNRSEFVNYLKKTCFFILMISLFFSNVSANNNGKVSVIIPVYNVEKYIRECLDSVINQTYKNLEIICVDDCSPDNSGKIIDEYVQKDKRVKVIRHDKNRGAGTARNTGVQNSDGEYIFFLDSDDYLNLDIIELLVQKQKETDADIIVSNFRIFTLDQGADIEKRLELNQDLLKFAPQERCKISFDNFQDNLNSIFCVSWGKLYKKDFLIKNNVWHINQNIYYEDGGFCLKALSHFPLVSFISDVGVNYRIHPYSSTHSSNDKKDRTDGKIMLKDFFQYLDQHFEKDTAEKLKKLTIKAPRYNKFFKKSKSEILLEYAKMICGLKS